MSVSLSLSLSILCLILPHNFTVAPSYRRLIAIISLNPLHLGTECRYSQSCLAPTLTTSAFSPFQILRARVSTVKFPYYHSLKESVKMSKRGYEIALLLRLCSKLTLFSQTWWCLGQQAQDDSRSSSVRAHLHCSSLHHDTPRSNWSPYLIELCSLLIPLPRPARLPDPANKQAYFFDLPAAQ